MQIGEGDYIIGGWHGSSYNPFPMSIGDLYTNISIHTVSTLNVATK
jgi:hypothetical protein